ncbi:hypothetical protein [Bradyrhizobium sp. USDA 3364]
MRIAANMYALYFRSGGEAALSFPTNACRVGENRRLRQREPWTLARPKRAALQTGSFSMPNKHLVVGVDWYGPYELERAREVARDYGKGGLYLCLGKLKGQHHVKMHYVGKSNNGLASRLRDDHHKLREVPRDRTLWLGVVGTGGVPGKRKLLTPQSLHLAEWAIAHFLDLRLNDSLRLKRPPEPVTILSRWWRADYETPHYHRPHPAWPDLIDYLGPEYRSRLVWFGQRQSVLPPVSL